jgi:hypothetical protein
MCRYLLALACASLLAAADLPVRQVILYKHGVGYFERSGTLGPGESARLDFKASEMNDVLKSLTVEDRGGGKVAGVRYDSAEPWEQKQGEFPFSIGDAQPLAAVLDQFKGARVELKFGSGAVTGTVVSGRVAPAGRDQPEREQVTLLLDSGEVHTYDLGAASSVRFVDAKLQTQFRDYLAALAGSRSKERRSVYIDSTDARSRQISAGYIIPSPVWKSSYRLVFGQAGGTLEGWAIVDNTTGEDWTKVQLSLVSGRPISFVSALYEPRYVRRPTASLPEEQALAPTLYAGAVAEEAPPRGGVVGGILGGAGGGQPSMKAAPPPPAPMAAAPMMMDRMGRAEMSSSLAETATGRELGELFEYRIPTPVTVRKSESAMLPFLQQKVETRKLLIYSDEGAQNPMNAAEIVNSTGKTLDGGPITIFDGGAYGGEALMETLKAGDKRLISYAQDLGTRITTALDSQSEGVREVHLRRGVLTTRSAVEETRTYTIRNVDAKPKTLIVEHPVRPGYKLLDLKPWETTPRAYRFEVKLAPNASQKFPVREERVFDSSFAITNLAPDMILSYARNKGLSDAGRKQLEQIVGIKNRMAEADAEIRNAESELNDIARDQDRLRKNIASLNQVGGQQSQVQDYARKLAEQEARLAALRDRISDLRTKRAALEREQNQAIEKADF